MKIFALYNIKGGVGKTASAVNLAYLSALEGHRTLVWDLDPQGAASFYFRIRPKVAGGAKALLTGKRSIDESILETDFPGLDLLPADFSYRNLDQQLDRQATRAPNKEKKRAFKPSQRFAELLLPLAEHYDHLFLDCAPSISRTSDAVFVAADVLLVPMIPTTLSVRTLEQLASHLSKKKRRRVQVLPFFTMVDRRKSLHREIVTSGASMPYPPLEPSIPYSSLIERMGIERAPLLDFAFRSAPAEAYRRLWSDVLGAATGEDGN